jgi:hypothetical protein
VWRPLAVHADAADASPRVRNQIRRGAQDQLVYRYFKIQAKQPLSLRASGSARRHGAQPLLTARHGVAAGRAPKARLVSNLKPQSVIPTHGSCAARRRRGAAWARGALRRRLPWRSIFARSLGQCMMQATAGVSDSRQIALPTYSTTGATEWYGSRATPDTGSFLQ